MIDRLKKSVVEYMNINPDAGAAERINLTACKVILAVGFLTVLMLMLTEKIVLGRVSYGAILGLVCFVVLICMFLVNYEAVCAHATFVLNGMALISMVLVAYVESTVNRSSPAFVLMVMLIVVPTMIMEKPWKLVLLVLICSLISVLLSRLVNTPEIFATDMTHLIPVTFISCVLASYTAHERILAVQMHETSKSVASHDPLTGILNRGGGSTMIRSCVQSRLSGTFMIIDIDDFKHVNDNYGHQKGDEVLQAVARTLRDSFKASDVVMRMGGDEFVVYAMGMADYHVASYRIGQLIEAIHGIVIDEEKNDYVTVSIGGVINDGTYPDYDSIYKVADKYLYKTKEMGKDGFNLYNASFK